MTINLAKKIGNRPAVTQLNVDVRLIPEIVKKKEEDNFDDLVETFRDETTRKRQKLADNDSKLHLVDMEETLSG
ncbi:hypothetical protein HZS_7389 [Henneguya salminicola]|nr:hypothetical protein HZS_7389 [Henneguya salminicola]